MLPPSLVWNVCSTCFPGRGSGLVLRLGVGDCAKPNVLNCAVEQINAMQQNIVLMVGLVVLVLVGEWGGQSRSRPVFGDLFTQEVCASSQLFDSVDTVFDADPTVEAFAF